MPMEPHKLGPRAVRMIIERTAKHYGFSVEELRDFSSAREPLPRARHVAMYLCREDTPATFAEIARSFGITNHSTIINGVKTIQNLLDEHPNSDLADSIRTLRVNSDGR